MAPFALYSPFDETTFDETTFGEITWYSLFLFNTRCPVHFARHLLIFIDALGQAPSHVLNYLVQRTVPAWQRAKPTIDLAFY
jgi:hypothetical protein